MHSYRRYFDWFFSLVAVCLLLSGAVASADLNWGAVQWPFGTTTTVGVATESLFGRVYKAGVTDSPGQGAGIAAELGYGNDGTLPWADPSWTWGAASYFSDIDNDDQYVATVTPVAAGVYDYAYRFTDDGFTYLYADMRDIAHPSPPGGSDDGYDPADAGHLVVEEGGDVLCPKWVQPPDCEFGVDLPSYAIPPDEVLPPEPRWVVGDDWLCDGRPITAIRWWGSYPGWGAPGLPPLRPIAFRLTWYTDIPATPTFESPGYSRPGDRLTNVVVALLPPGVGSLNPGEVTETYYCTVPKIVPPGVEHEYEYFVKLPEPWNEKRGRIYWLTIEAIYPFGYEPDPIHPEWGWKTSTEVDIIDDAVVWPGDLPPETWLEMIWPAYPWLPGLFYPPDQTTNHFGMLIGEFNQGPSINMAFELLTDVCPRRTEKWEQPPDMIEGTDMWSWMTLGETQRSEFLRADDFISDGRRITDIHWWGSYSNWMIQVNGSETNPIAPPGTNAFMRPLGFNLSWHTNSPGLCTPGAELTNVFVDIAYCHEMFYGTVFQYWEAPPLFEHEYQYYVDLLDVAEPWYELKDGHYWLNIEAVFDPLFVPSDQGENLHGGWGWNISLLPPEGMPDCFAAVSNRLGGAWEVDPVGLPPGHPREFDFYNLAFELTTDEISTNSPTLPIVITNTVTAGTSTTHVVTSVGTSGTGTQYLQMNTNLLTNVWTDVAGQVKVAPFPPPITNTWMRVGATETSVFYRVLEK